MEGAVYPGRVGIMIEALKKIIADLEDRPELQQIFGAPVSRSLVVVADNNDLRIEEGGQVAMTEEQLAIFMQTLMR